MKILKEFKVSENSKKFDQVTLVMTDEYEFIVIWKWTTMKNSTKRSYNNYEEALKKYKERKHFAIICN